MAAATSFVLADLLLRLDGIEAGVLFGSAWANLAGNNTGMMVAESLGSRHWGSGDGPSFGCNLD